MSPRESSRSAGPLREAWLRLHAQGRRARDAAATLGVSEAELVASTCTEVEGPMHATPLAVEDVEALRALLTTLGVVKTQTRSGGVVLEVVGRYPAARITAQKDQWTSCFAVREGGGQAERRSLQIFDTTGAAIQKVFLLRESDAAAFERLARAIQVPLVARGYAAAAEPEPAGTPSGQPTSLPSLLRRLSSEGSSFTLAVTNRGAVHTHSFAPRRVSSKSDWLAVTARDAKALIHRSTRALTRRTGATMTVELSSAAGCDATLSEIPYPRSGPKTPPGGGE